VRAAVAATLAALATTLALVGGSPALAEVESSRAAVLDRTYACAVFIRGGAYLVDTHAHAGSRLNGAWARLPYAGVHSGVFSGGAGNLLAWITSGTPTSTTMVDQDYDAFGAKAFGTVGIRRDGCRRSSASVRLGPVGLRGGAATPLGSKSECYAPKRVLVRFRAVLASPGAFRAGPDFQTLHLRVRAAKLAVRTPAGKALVYADVVESGRARLFTAPGCSSG
jgi:hypothetical protein